MIEIKMPRLSDTMEEGAISTWRKHPGEPVAVGDVLVEIETDKAVMEYEAYQAGVLSKILVDEGQTAQIGTAIALIDDGSSSNEDAPAASEPAADNSKKPEAAGADAPEQAPAASGPDAPPAPASSAPASSAPASSAPASSAQASSAQASPAAASANGHGDVRLLASPLVRKLAREGNLDLSRVQGSGPGGRIIRADLSGLLAADAGTAPPAAPAPAAPAGPGTGAGQAAAVAPAAAQPDAAPAETAPAPADDVRGARQVPVSQVRRVIARRLSASAREIPHFYVTAAADAEELMALRADLNGKLTAAGRPKLSVNDLLIRAVALALRAHPEVNASYEGESAATMLIHDRVNIGVAVAAPSGLIVPVIPDADTKTVTQLGAEAKELVKLAADRKLTPAQTSGGTFTISNLGMFGVEDFTAIINPPEAAILAVGATTREPAVVGDEIVPRYRMRYTMSSDHRVIDGALAARFLKTLTELIESPWLIVA
ncbi:MAG TPA: dihydrolipoamide acetyltransferase family protein [Trebonia sp.]|nr:dihydrolipoamide acetyltransferase family protein [Trebonia sp.]